MICVYTDRVNDRLNATLDTLPRDVLWDHRADETRRRVYFRVTVPIRVLFTWPLDKVVLPFWGGDKRINFGVDLGKYLRLERGL